MKILTGIVTFQNEKTISPCLNSLLQQTEPPEHIHIFDNSSTDSTVAFINKNFPELKLTVSNKNLGFGCGHNAILATAEVSFDAYLLLNPDVVLAPDFLKIMKTQLFSSEQSKQKIGAINGLVCYLENGEKSNIIYSCGHILFRDRRVEDLGIGLSVENFPCQTQIIFGFNGACALIKNSALQEVSYSEGPFDKRYFLYGEDDDLNWRLALRGWNTEFCPAARSWHAAGSSRAFLDPRARKDAIANRWLSILKNDHPLLILRDLHWIILLEIAYWGLRTIRRPAFLKDLAGALLKFIRFLPSTLQLRYQYNPRAGIKLHSSIIEKNMLPRLRTLIGRSKPQTDHKNLWSKIES